MTNYVIGAIATIDITKKLTKTTVSNTSIYFSILKNLYLIKNGEPRLSILFQSVSNSYRGGEEY